MSRKSAPESEENPPEISDNSETGPIAVSVGTYALYRTPDGGAHLVYRAEGAEEDVHMPIPAMALQLASKMAEGDLPIPPMLQKMLGKRRAKSAVKQNADPV